MDGIDYRKVAANGQSFNVALAGQGPPVLLLHGFPDTHTVWQKQIAVLAAAGYRVIAPDQRGCGDTDMPARTGDYKLDTLRADMEALLDALDVREPVRLVGHDWGAVVGWKLAIDAPQRFHSYLAMSVGHPAEYQRGLEQKLRAWYAFLFLLPGIAEALIRAGDWGVFRRLANDPIETQARIRALSRPGRLTAGLRWYRANAWRMLVGRFGKTPLPVFGLWSDGDFALVESQMSNSQRQVTGPWRYARIERASHWMQLDRPDDINRLLLDWFATSAA
ncbi:MAG: alpha/beta fold hydrolase [Solimonas sp.]